jgi:hypothetical protein
LTDDKIKIFFTAWLLLSCNGNAVDGSTHQDNLQQTTKVVLQRNEVDFFLNRSESIITLTPHTIQLQKGIGFGVNIPAGYNTSVAAWQHPCMAPAG